MIAIRLAPPGMFSVRMETFGAESLAVHILAPSECNPIESGESYPVFDIVKMETVLSAEIIPFPIKFSIELFHFVLPLMKSLSSRWRKRQGEQAPISVLLREPQVGQIGQ